MTEFSSAELDSGESYRLLTNLVVPRPIALVATRNSAGIPNLAPFSFFNAVNDRPPMLAFSIGSRVGPEKDTLLNLREHPEFIVHIVGEEQLPALVMTSGEYAPVVDEFAVAGFTKAAAAIVDVPRIIDAPIAFECLVHTILPLGDTPYLTHHVIGSIAHWHIADVLCCAPHLDSRPMRPVGRMGNGEFVRLNDRFQLGPEKFKK